MVQLYNWYFSAKGNLISESFSLWLKSPKKRCQITTLNNWHPNFGDLSKSEFFFFEILLPLLRHLGTHPLCFTLTMIKRDKIRARRCSQAQRGYSFSIQRKRTQYLYICHCGQWSGGSDCFFSDCVKGIEWGGFSLPSLNNLKGP
mgnify:CR=1 FL=1